MPGLATLCREARDAHLAVTLDAEESERLDLTLDVFEALGEEKALRGWDGLGIAVQAYQKRALPLIAEVHSTAAAGVRATTNNGLSVDLRIVPPENFGNLLQHFTGSGKHNEALRNWVRQAEADAGERADRPTSDENEELRRLRKEVSELRRVNEILKAASAFFAQEIDPTSTSRLRPLTIRVARTYARSESLRRGPTLGRASLVSALCSSRSVEVIPARRPRYRCLAVAAPSGLV